MEKQKASFFDRLCRQRNLRKQVCEERERLYRLAFAWSHDAHRADDLVQETLARGLSKLDTLKEEARLQMWLTRIMLNLHRDSFRRTQEETGLDIESVSPHIGPEAATDQAQMVLRTRQALASLKHEQREIITLIDLSGFSYADTARILDVPVGTVMSRLSRARKRLRDALETRQAAQVVPLRQHQ